MRELYMQPQVDVVAFAPSAKLASGWKPDWGYEDDVFGESIPEAKTLGDEGAEN